MGNKMTESPETSIPEQIPLFISRSNITTEVNKTGSWRFMRPKYDEKTAPCGAACPVGEDIPRIEMLISQGLFKDALETTLEENPFPSVCGHVCFYPCENACNRAELDESIAIHSLERFLGDNLSLKGINPYIEKLPSNGKKVFIAGAGPAGLAAAYFLVRLGYTCDVFEAKKEPGGILRWGIPVYRLPEKLLKNEIKRIEDLGVKIHCEKPVTKSLLKDIQSQYDAIFMGCGLNRSIKMNIPGEEVASSGLDFLYKIRKGEKISVHGTVAVIGGGNTAIDVARSLIRLDAKPIIVYRRRKQDMPAFFHETEMAIKEGVQLMEQLAPIQIAKDNEDYVLTLQKMKVKGTDKSGRAFMVPDGSKTQKLRVKKIFTALGAEQEEDWNREQNLKDKRLNLSHCILTDKELPFIYGGDLTNEIKSVANAIASGKQAAIVLDTLFQKGWNSIEDNIASCRIGSGASLSMEIYRGGARKARNPFTISYKEINKDYFQPAGRMIPSSVSHEKNIKSFLKFDRTISNESAVEEARRCFNCGICNDCDNCRLFCPEVAVILEDRRQINLDYCKGCGVCVMECPRNAMTLDEEKA